MRFESIVWKRSLLAMKRLYASNVFCAKYELKTPQK